MFDAIQDEMNLLLFLHFILNRCGYYLLDFFVKLLLLFDLSILDSFLIWLFPRILRPFLLISTVFCCESLRTLNNEFWNPESFCFLHMSCIIQYLLRVLSEKLHSNSMIWIRLLSFLFFYLFVWISSFSHLYNLYTYSSRPPRISLHFCPDNLYITFYHLH
jgi:hypothetical protein